MAAAQVLVGLTTISDAETVTGYERIGNTSGGGASNPGINDEVYIQGANSVSRLLTGAGNVGGLQFDVTTNEDFDTTAADQRKHVYLWLYNLANSSIDNVTNGGARIYLSDGTQTNYYEYYCGGFDVTPTGGWNCFVASPRQLGRVVGGTGFSTSSVGGFGGEFAMTASVSRFDNFAIDAIRVGTGLTVYNGDTAAPAGISSLTSVNDDELNRYGVCTRTSSGAIIQGKIGIGLDDTSTETYYSDSDIVILVPNKNPIAEEATPFFNTLEDFTGISIEGGITTSFFSNVFFNSVDPYDKGYFSCSDATNLPVLVEIDGCTFQKWGPTRMSSSG